MIKLNWMIILGIVILLVLLYINNKEHFAGTISPANLEAISNISTMANSGNLRLTNITATNTLNSPSTTSPNINTNTIALGDARIQKGEKSPDTIDFMLGDGTGWGINFKKYNGTQVARINDQGNLNLTGDANISGKANITGDTNITGKLKLNKNGMVFLFGEINCWARTPIKDENGNTFSFNEWICLSNIVQANNAKGVVTYVGKDGNWWVYGTECGANIAQILLIPKNYFQYVSKFEVTNDPSNTVSKIYGLGKFYKENGTVRELL
jgi:hypothetical protein